MASLWEALKQYASDAMPGGLLNQETAPVASKSSRLAGLLGDAAQTGAMAYTQANQPASPELTKSVLGLLPGIGDAISGYDAIQSARDGDWLGAGLNGVGLLPFVPALGGMIKTPSGRIPETIAEVDRLSAMLRRHGENAGETVVPGHSNVSASSYLTFKRNELPDLQVRISNHGDRYPNQLAATGERFSVDPESRNTYEEATQWLKDNGVNLSKTQKQPPMPEWVRAKSDYAAVYPQAVKNLQAKGFQVRPDDNFQRDLGTEIGKLLGMF